jgi:hypothetical protein
MAKVKLDLRKKTVPAKVLFARNIVIAMTGNTNFTTPVPGLPVITSAANNLETAWQAAQDGGQSATLTMNQREKDLNLALTQLAAYVENTSAGDAEIIMSAGMQIKATAQPSAPAQPPVDVRLEHTGNEGEISIRWKKQGKSLVHLIRFRTEAAGSNSGGTNVPPPPMPPPMPTPMPGEPNTSGSAASNWQDGGASTGSKKLLTELPVGDRIWVQVAAVNSKSTSGWSDPATKVIS